MKAACPGGYVLEGEPYFCDQHPDRQAEIVWGGSILCGECFECLRDQLNQGRLLELPKPPLQ